MNNSDQDKQDQRTGSGMEDSTAMTIDFLRARLLSERSVSRTARQRADELAQRVAELEEQLRIVSLQRMKAERATADVLAILEGNGISDISDTFYSSSDQDTPCESKVGDRSSKEDENSVNSKVKDKELEELSASDHDISSVPGRSLSWKGCKDTSSHSLGKYKDPSVKRRSKFASVGSSSKQHPGKSCRQIRRKESRSVAEEYKANPVKHDSQEDEIAISSENFPNTLGFESKMEGVKLLLEDADSDCLGKERNASDNGPDYNVYAGERDMQKALEQQAQLIGQYEAMEKAQREWEEKFRENNTSTPDSCDPGNHSDITEDRYEIRAPAADQAMPNGFQTRPVRSEVKDLSKTESNGFLPSAHVDAESLEERKSTTEPVSESSTQDFVFLMSNGKQNQEESLGKNYRPPSQIPHHESTSLGSQCSASQSVPSFPSNTCNSLNKEKAVSESQNEHYALMPHKSSDGLGGVLEALKEARQSLQQRINRLPLVDKCSRKSVEPSFPITVPGDDAQIPIGCVGLFRLPNDFSVEGNAQADLRSSSARLSLGNHYSNKVPAFARYPSVSSLPLENRQSFSSGDQMVTTRYVGVEPRIPTQKPYFDRYLDTGLPSSSRYTYPNYPINTSYPDTHVTGRETFLASVPGRTNGMPNANYFSFSDYNGRLNMYR